LGINYDFFNPYNLIHYLVSFLSRSTEESGISQKDSKEKEEGKIIAFEDSIELK